MKYPVCAKCNKRIKQRERFSLHYETRPKYSKYYSWASSEKNLRLYFHKNCILKMNINCKKLFNFLKITGEIGLE